MKISSGFTPKGVEKKRGGKRMGNHSGNSDLPENSNWLKSQLERKGITSTNLLKNQLEVH